jgi:GGDEF domain-containing protein
VVASSLDPNLRPKHTKPANRANGSKLANVFKSSDDCRSSQSFARPVGFDRVAGEVLEHLLLTSPLGQWIVVRFDGDDRQRLRIVKSAGDAFALAPELGITRADLSGTLAGRLVRLRGSSLLARQLGVRSCVAAVIGDSIAGTSAPYGAIVGMDSSLAPTLPEGFGGQLRLHASHLESALSEHRSSFAMEHARIAERDLVNGFDTAAAWADRVHLVDRHCAAIGDDASVAVIDVDGLGVLKQHFGYLAADEFLREISFTLRSLSLPNAHFARLADDRIVVVRVGPERSHGFNLEYWANDLRVALNLAIVSSSIATASAVRCRVGVASRIWGQRRGLELAQNRATKQASAATPNR